MAFWNRKPSPLDQRLLSALYKDENYQRLLRKPQIRPGSELEKTILANLNILEDKATIANREVFNSLIPCLSGSNSTLRQAAERALTAILARGLSAHQEADLIQRLKDIVQQIESDQNMAHNPLFLEYLKPFKDALDAISGL